MTQKARIPSLLRRSRGVRGDDRCPRARPSGRRGRRCPPAVPLWAILAGTSFGYVSVAIYYFFPANVFTWLINASGAIALFAYLLIAISELVMRRRLEREDPESLQLRMWFYPWLTYLSIAAMVAVLVAMFIIPDQRPLLIASLISLGVILGAYLLRRWFGPPERSPSEIIREHD
jgi:GABA permease